MKPDLLTEKEFEKKNEKKKTKSIKEVKMKNSNKPNGFCCPLSCRNCVVTEKELFNRKNPDFPNGNWNAELQFRTLAEKIEACEDRINEWRNNGNGTSLKSELRDFAASVSIYLLKQKPPLPLKYMDDNNLEKLKSKCTLLKRVAQFFEIEPKKLKKLL